MIIDKLDLSKTKELNPFQLKRYFTSINNKFTEYLKKSIKEMVGKDSNEIANLKNALNDNKCTLVYMRLMFDKFLKDNENIEDVTLSEILV